MKTVALGEVVDFYSGATPSKSRPDLWVGDVPWFSAKDLKHPRLSDSLDHVSREVFTSSPLRKLPAGTVVMVVRGMILAHTVPVSILDAEAAINQDLKALLPRAPLDSSFLAHMLRAQQNTILGHVATAAHGTKKLDSRVLRELRIPFPSLDEQRRIAAILDQADALRAKRLQTLTHVDALTQSIFLDMFGDPAVNPQRWPTMRLGDLATRFRDGPFGSNLKSAHYVPAGVRVIRLQNIGVGELLNDDRAYVSEDHFATLSKHRCDPGDILIGTLGEPNLRACIQPKWLSLALNKADCVQMKVDTSRASAEWACWLLNMPGTLRLANSLVLGQTRSRISMGRLRELEVPVPPIALQRAFTARITQVQMQRAAAVCTAAVERELFDSVQARAFADGL